MSLLTTLNLRACQELCTSKKYLDTRFVHVRHVVARAGVYVARPVPAVERASSAFRPAVNSVTCVTAMHSLLLFASFLALAGTRLARKGIRCRVLVLHRRLYGVVLQHCSNELISGLARDPLIAFFSGADAEETAVTQKQ